MRAMVLAWEPDWAITTSDGLWEQLSNGSRIGGFVGWMTYFSRRRGELPVLPAPVRVEPLEDKGTLVILTPERLTVSNPGHVALARHVQSLLDARGLLTWVVPPRAPGGS